jgi:HEAT repeat protein
MMTAAIEPTNASSSPVSVIGRHLETGEDVVRCAAAKALGAMGDTAAAPILVEALLDEDPDVRFDAMTALAVCGRAEDAETIRCSLLGDPVKEVKVAAIKALVRLCDAASVPLLRGLAKSRCEEEVAWEDDAGMWDDWLDVQLAAIDGLGEMGATDAVDDLRSARVDEMGQELDETVFATLARIPEGGVAALLNYASDSDPRVRERALSTLANTRADLVAPMLDRLARDTDPNLRRLALRGMSAADPRIEELALRDPDAGVRRAALSAFASERPDIAEAALADADEEARAVAVEALVSAGATPPRDLGANLVAWMKTAGGRLAAVSAMAVPKFATEAAEDALVALASDADRPQEARIAALRALPATAAGLADVLRGLAADPVQSIRAAALATAAGLAASDDGARALLIEAMHGRLLPEGETAAQGPVPSGDAAGASKAEEESDRGIIISPEGEIVPRGAAPDADSDADAGNVIEVQFPRTTLEAIQATAGRLTDDMDAALTEDDLIRLSERPGEQRRRRVSVDGPEGISVDLRIVALRIGTGLAGEDALEALLAALSSADARTRAAAYEALALRSEKMTLTPEVAERLAGALSDPDPLIRGYAARCVANASPDAAELLRPRLTDPDASVRAEATRALGRADRDKLLELLRDQSGLVRKAAITALLDQTAGEGLDDALQICMAQGWVDTLATACRESPAARSRVLLSLASGDPVRRKTCAALEALAMAPVGAGTVAVG